MKHIIVLALFVGCFVSCSKSKNTSQDYEPPPLTYGCRAWVETRDGSRNSVYLGYTVSTHSEAVREIRREYQEEFPKVRKFESNCWSCDTPGLDEDSRKACTRHICAR
ncbi:MAG: hypothetical protein P1P90_00935 [Patescibacteria group bacterium]|nr:hypothetical protein [Patescibacteria group bacterium]